MAEKQFRVLFFKIIYILYRKLTPSEAQTKAMNSRHQRDSLLNEQNSEVEMKV